MGPMNNHEPARRALCRSETPGSPVKTLPVTGLTVYGCDQDEAILFGEFLGADDPTLRGDRTSSTANCFRVSATYRPSRRNASSRSPATSRTGGLVYAGGRAP